MRLQALIATAMFCMTGAGAYASASADPGTQDNAPQAASPAHHDSRRIDIGEIEVTGEMRKPLLDYLNSDQYMKGLLPQIAKEQMDRIDRQLLRSDMGKRVSPELRSRQEKQAKEIENLTEYEKSLTAAEPKRRTP